MESLWRSAVTPGEPSQVAQSYTGCTREIPVGGDVLNPLRGAKNKSRAKPSLWSTWRELTLSPRSSSPESSMTSTLFLPPTLPSPETFRQQPFPF